MWTTPDQDPRSYAQPQGELATYREYLTNYRLTIGMKCDGLDADQLARRSVPPSSMSLLGLVRHLANVEHHWFVRVLQQVADRPDPFDDAEDRDWDFNGAVAEADVVTEAFTTWRSEIEAADRWLDTVDERELGREVPLRDGLVSVRDVIVHLIEEYARHAGHADLLRECIDGRAGQ